MEDNENELEDVNEDDLADTSSDIDTESFNDFDELQENNSKQKLLIGALVGLVLLLILILVFVFILGGKDSNKEEPKKEEEQQEKKEEEKKEEEKKEEQKKDEDEDEDLEEDTRPRTPRTEKKMILYNVDGTYVEDSYCDDSCKGKSSVGINIEDLDAKLVDVYPDKKFGSKEYPRYIMFVDGSKVRYFDTKELRSYVVKMSSEFRKYEMIVYNDTIEAIAYKTKGEKGIYTSGKYMYKNQYDSFKAMNDKYIYGIKGDKQDVLSMTEEKVISSGEAAKEKKGEFFLEKTTDSSGDLYNIYDSNYNLIVDRVRDYLFSISNSSLYLVKNNKVYEYDKNGKEGYVSNPYEAVVCMAGDYFIATNSGKVMVIKVKSNDVVAEEDLDTGYKVEPTKSGYFTSSKVTNRTGAGVYVVLDDGTDIKEFKYDPSTNKVVK